jgi:hypothetical protein
VLQQHEQAHHVVQTYVTSHSLLLVKERVHQIFQIYHHHIPFVVFSGNFKIALKQLLLVVLQPFGDPK